MINKPKIALDIDGVIANFYLAMCREFDLEYKTIDNWDDPRIMKHFDEIRNNFRFWATIPLMIQPDAIGFDFDYYMTSIPMTDQAVRGRELWLSENGFPDKSLIVTNDKLNKCIELDIDILVDDKPRTITEINKSSCKTKAVQFIPAYFGDALVNELYPKINFLPDLKEFI